MATKTEPKMVEGYRSHWVELDYEGLRKEEVYPRFECEWRGERVVVTMSCDRYRHSSGLSDWRVYASEAHVYEGETRKGSVTDLARRRLGDECHSLAIAWLASDEYKISECAAYIYAIKREIQDERGSNQMSARGKIVEHLDKLGAAAPRLARVCNLWDQYHAALEEMLT